MLLVLSDKGKGMQSSSEQPLVGEEHCVTTLITAAKETSRNLTTRQNENNRATKNRDLNNNIDVLTMRKLATQCQSWVCCLESKVQFLQKYDHYIMRSIVEVWRARSD